MPNRSRRFCCIPLCQLNFKINETSSYHEFPARLDLREKWIKIVAMTRLETVTDGIWQPCEYSKVCSKHFKPTDFQPHTKKTTLKSNVVPTVFKDYPVVEKEAEKLALAPMGPPVHPRFTLPKVLFASVPKIKSESLNEPSSQVKCNMQTNKACQKDASTQVTPWKPAVIRRAVQTVPMPPCGIDRGVQVTSTTFCPRKFEEMRKKLIAAQHRCGRLKNQVKRLKDQIVATEVKKKRANKYPFRKVIKAAKSGSVHAQFLLEQSQVYFKNLKHPRFSKKTMEHCYTWRQYCSSRSYEYVKRVGLLRLPSGKTLGKFQLSQDAAQQAATKQEESERDARLAETIEHVVNDMANFDDGSIPEESVVHADGSLEVVPVLQDRKPTVYELTISHANYNDFASSDNTGEEAKPGASQPTIIQVFTADDHCYYGSVPTVFYPAEPCSTQTQPHTIILEQVIASEITGDFSQVEGEPMIITKTEPNVQ